MKIYWIADGHLAELLYARRPLIRGDAYRALQSICEDICITAERGDSVVMLGDMLNTPRPSSSDIAALQRAVNTLKIKGLEVYAIQGNHDRAPVSWTSTCGVKDLKPWVVEIVSGYKVLGFDYVNGEEVKKIMDRLQSGPECDFLLFHFGFTHNDPFSPFAIDTASIPDTVRKGTLAGHIHRFSMERSMSGIPVISVGSTHARASNEDRGGYLMYDGYDFIYIPTPTVRTRIKSVVYDDAGLAEFKKTILDPLPETEDPDIRPLVMLKHSLELLGKVAALSELSVKQCHLISEGFEETSDETVEAGFVDECEINPDSILSAMTHDSKAYSMVLDIVKNPKSPVIEEYELEIRKELEDAR